MVRTTIQSLIWLGTKRRNRKMKFGKLLISIVIVSLLVSMAIPMAAAPKGGGGKPPKDDPTPADPVIAYSTIRGKSLWVMDADGSHQTQIHATDENIGKPTWAPDGSAIAFTVGIGYKELWRIDVSVVDGVPVGSNPMMLHSSIYYAPEWSPAGDVIVFAELISDLIHLRTIPATGGDPTTLYTAPSGFATMDPTWSPDASSIAYAEMELFTGPDNYRINVFDVASTEVTTVYGPVTTNIYWLEWGKSPGSTEIVFSMITGGGFSVYTIDIASPSPTPVLIEGGDSRFPSWSPDDSQVIYTSLTPRPKGQKMDWKIWVEDLATGDKTELAKAYWALDWKR